MEAHVAGMWHARNAGGMYPVAVQRLTLVRLLFDRGETARAVSLSAEFAESLRVLWEIGARWNLTQALELAAALMAAGQQVEPAARLLGAAAALREALPYPVGAQDRATLARQLDEVSTVLGEPAFTRAWAAGRAQPLDAIVAEARSVLATMAP